YPLSVLMLSGITEVLVISTPHDLPQFQALLGDGKAIGMSFSYIEQPSPDGLAQAFILGEEFIGDDDVCLILGDNIFYGHGLVKMLASSIANVENDKKATVFGYFVKDPERYGVVDFDDNGNVLSIEEKPDNPQSHYAVVGLYFYPNSVVEIAKQIKPSKRGELEITTVNQKYLEQGDLKVELMGRGYAWLDTGTHESLLEASNFIQTIENRQGLKVACLEEIAYEMGYIDKEKLIELAQPLKKNQYGQYLIRRAGEDVRT
ncbi:MAG: glucose-1-phosphate thymidylyltransferase RfbA, partial [Gammaproteobacteria bacterium]|nr:glucose-1-phosphate thymidylyltransferase RfbA [Gammaproteobacteria bacterium]